LQFLPIDEYLWREFYMMILWHFPHIVENSFKTQYDRLEWLNNEMEFEAWCKGKTGYPIVDAGMRELKTNGWMHNRGRMIVASFLVKDLGVDWRFGAECFESQLIDYDVGSNWGNWNYIAGVGSDPREDRYFNILSQAKRYDPQGDYVKLWLPELKDVPSDKVHQPDQLSNEEQDEWSVILGADYPKALVRTEKWGV
jgi:deoxyribodipyrimidine photo-lyase